MTAGLQVWDANGVLVTEITDRLSRLIMAGSVTLAVGASTTIACADMQDTDEWFVSCTLGNVGVPGSGAFTLYQTGEKSGIFYYSVFRR